MKTIPALKITLVIGGLIISFTSIYSLNILGVIFGFLMELPIPLPSLFSKYQRNRYNFLANMPTILGK